MEFRIVVDALADMHIHFREKPLVKHLIALALQGGADVFGIMGNLIKALTTAQATDDYRKYAESVDVSLPPTTWPYTIMPIVVITEDTTPKTIDECVAAGILDGKAYPFQRTTQSEHGVRRYGRLLPIIKHCGKVGMRVHFHPEMPSKTYINRDAEHQFVPIVEIFLQETEATIVWEHGTDSRCIPHWEEFAQSGRFCVTLTAHHLATNEDFTFGDVRATCKPPIKTEFDRQALVDFVWRDYPWVMAGSDAAFHPREKKHVATGCCACGDFTYPFVMPLYAHALDLPPDNPGKVEVFQNFTSRNARKAFGLPPASRQITLERTEWEIPLEYRVGEEVAMPFMAGQKLNWRIIKQAC